MMRFYFKIKLLGRQLEFPSASSSTSPDSQSDTTNPGAAMDDEESPPLPPSASEKETKQPTDYLALGAGVLRVWQLSSSCFVYASTVSLYVYMRHVSLISDSSTLRHVRELGLVSCAYGTLVIFSLYIFRRWPRVPGWVVFAWSTFPGDLMMTGLAVTKITLLSQAGLPHDCRGLVSNSLRLASFQSALVNQMPQTQAAPPSFGTQLSMESLCHVPRTAFAFCVIAIFSYTLSILLTVFQLQRHHKKLDIPPPRSYPGYIEVVVPAHVTRREPAPIPFTRAAPPARPHPPSILRNPPPPRATPVPFAPSHTSSPSYSASSSSPYTPASSSYYASTSASFASPSTSYAPYASPSTSPSTVSSSLASASSSYTPHTRSLPSTLPAQDDPHKYANMPPMEIVTVNPRLSIDTTSTDPEIYLVTDGFRPEDPPEYSSRPSSLYRGEPGP